MQRAMRKVLAASFLVLLFVAPLAQGAESKTALLKIDGITWVFCVPALQALLMKLEGVKKTEVDWKKGEVAVGYDSGKVTTSQMVKAVNESGVFKVKAVEDHSRQKTSSGRR